MYENILVTGGSGFIGSNIAVSLKQSNPAARVLAFDNLKRRGSELNLPRLRKSGVDFQHGDIRSPEDLAVPHKPYDLIIECSAEPSVLAGYDGSARFVVNTNLMGTVNCLELARACRADFLFLSTSRIYPMDPLNALAHQETPTRYELSNSQKAPGASAAGISEDFPLAGSRTLYGATKLASELLIEEYRSMYGLKTIINRCGVVAGPWQMGRVDQGVFTLWMLNHHFRMPLKYIGYGGSGKQVRDLLHVADLFDLIDFQLKNFKSLDGSTFNAGGGTEVSLSLLETTSLCQKIVGHSIPIESIKETRTADVRIYITDNAKVSAATGWRPKRDAATILSDIHRWIVENESAIADVFNFAK